MCIYYLGSLLYTQYELYRLWIYHIIIIFIVSMENTNRRHSSGTISEPNNFNK